MLETFLGSQDFNSTSPAMSSTLMPHTLQMRRQALETCNLVIGHLPENPIRMEEVHRAQNTFRLRALLLRSLQEVGEWGDLVDGIKIGINPAVARHSLPVDSAHLKEITLDNLLLQVHSIRTLVRDKTGLDTPPRDRPLKSPPGDASPASSAEHEVPRSLEAPGWRVLQPKLLSPEETLRIPLMLWPSTHGVLPSIALSTGDSRGEVWIERLKASTNTATSRLLRTWATRVQDILEARPSTTQDHVMPALVPSSTFQATLSLAVLASYLALSLSPTATSYNDLGIVLSSPDSQPIVRQPARPGSPNGAISQNPSRVYFEAGLKADPHNVYLLTNLGSHWKKEGNYEEAIRFV